MRRLALLALLLTGCASHHRAVQAVDALFRDYQGEVPGASVLVVKDGHAVVRRAYGLADVDHRVAATPATNYRLASVTKQFTAAAILTLVQDGRVSLEDRVRKWLPSLPVDVTIRQLLTHTSGVVDYEDFVTTRVLDADVLRILESQPRTYFAPGTSYRYSNSGYAMLALVVERASGRSFASFLRERIFRPLGMKNTVAHVEGVSVVSDRAYGHSFVDGRWLRTDQSLTSAVLGDGGVYSSIDDLARWDAALSAGSFAEAMTPEVDTDDPNTRYGFGWRITGDTVWHSGETMGFRNVIVRWPARRLTVVILTNRNDPEPYELARQVGALF